MNILKKIWVISFVLTCFINIQAQDIVSGNIEQLIADIYGQLIEESETEIDFSSFYDDLLFLSQNPINLNQASKEDLDKLHFLSDNQIDNILFYLYKNAPLKTIYELQLIDGLDFTDIKQMLPFVTLGDLKSMPLKMDFKKIFQYGKNELLFRLDHGLESKEGYRIYPEEDNEPNNKNSGRYIGDPFYTNVKYRFHYRDQFAAGFTAEKDAGEQFWDNNHKGYDFYSAHVELKNIGNLKTLVIGDYRANFGQGLVLRTDFAMGKSSYVMQVNPRINGLKKYTSTDEYNFFRGLGTTLRFGKIDLTAFYSNKNIDGDTTANVFPTIIKDGLHRTTNDLMQKHAVNQQVIGANVLFFHDWFQAGATVVHTHLSKRLEPEPAPYNYFYFKGKDQNAGSVNYRFKWKKLNLFGETAMTDYPAFATINGLDFSPASRISLVALYRYFSRKYDTFFANTFSESSRVNNESGFYLGMEMRPIRFWKVAAYVDSYRFPWVKFGVDAPSFGKDFLLQADFTPKRNVSMYWRFKYEIKSHNISDTISTMAVVLMQPVWSARYLLNYSFGRFSFRNQLDANGYNDGIHTSTFGFSALQDVNYEFASLPIQFNFRFQIFDNQDFNNRIYTYEKDVLYAFSVPMIYGLGTRYYVNFRYDIKKSLSIWLKFAQTVYADNREISGSGNDEIVGNRKSDFRLLIKWRF